VLEIRRPFRVIVVLQDHTLGLATCGDESPAGFGDLTVSNVGRRVWLVSALEMPVALEAAWETR
jgi:hypothetical protein